MGLPEWGLSTRSHSCRSGQAGSEASSDRERDSVDMTNGPKATRPSIRWPDSVEQLVVEVEALADATMFTPGRRGRSRWAGLVRRGRNELARRADRGQLDPGSSPAEVWAHVLDHVLVGDQRKIGVAGSTMSDALVRTRHRVRFCTPSILLEVEPRPLPAVFETSLSDREIGAAAEGDGCFGKVERKLARIHGAGAAYPFLDGSTSAIRVVAEWIADWTARPLVGVNRIAHKAVIHALETHRVPWYYLDLPTWCPEFDAAGPIVADRIELRAGTTHVWVNSVTYEGAIADVGAVKAAVKKRAGDGVVLIVDEAWGAHLRFAERAEAGSLERHRGLRWADIVTTSVHKQGGGRQGTALLLVRKGFHRRTVAQRLRATIRATITTSPKLPLLASLEGATATLAQAGSAHVEASKRLADRLGDELRCRASSLVDPATLSNADCLRNEAVAFDPLKVVVPVRGATGFEVADELRKQDVIVERDGFQSVLFLVPFQVDCHDVELAVQAMATVARAVASRTNAAGVASPPIPSPFVDTSRCPSFPETRANASELALQDSCGRIAADIVAAYPPGIPVIVPGAEITNDQIYYLEAVQRAGGHVVSGAGAGSADMRVFVRR